MIMFLSGFGYRENVLASEEELLEEKKFKEILAVLTLGGS